jgi:hypothetical protein
MIGAKMDQFDTSFRNVDRKISEWIIRLVQSDSRWLRRILLNGLRFAYRHRPAPIESRLKEAATYPTGPYAANRLEQIGDLLIWVPRRIESFIIDDLTGRYGYSHITVDTGEVDLPTGKPVMIEVTVGQTVERSFQDEYAGRAYSRIPLSKTGVDAEVFVTCVKSRLGERYDNLEALTLGEIDDPVKQMCSGLAADCLPETVRRDFVKARRLGMLSRASVSDRSLPNSPETKVFISPNGFAQYYGAPKGEKLTETNFVVKPHLIDIVGKGAVRRQDSKAFLILVIAGMMMASILFLITKYIKQRTITCGRQ